MRGRLLDTAKKKDLHLEGLQHILDARVLQLEARPQAVGARLHEHVPLNVAQRVVRRVAVALVVVEELAALAQGGAEVADDVQQRRRVPAYLGRVPDAVVPERLPRLDDDAGEDVEVLGEVAELGAELGVLGAFSCRAVLAIHHACDMGSRAMFQVAGWDYFFNRSCRLCPRADPRCGGGDARPDGPSNGGEQVGWVRGRKGTHSLSTRSSSRRCRRPMPPSRC